MGNTITLGILYQSNENIMENQIKEKMKLLAAKWVDKDPVHGSIEYMQKMIDRMIYRDLQRRLDKFNVLNPPKTDTQEDLISIGERIFETEQDIDRQVS